MVAQGFLGWCGLKLQCAMLSSLLLPAIPQIFPLHCSIRVDLLKQSTDLFGQSKVPVILANRPGQVKGFVSNLHNVWFEH